MFNPQTYLTLLVQQAGITDPWLVSQAVHILEPVLLDRISVSLMSYLDENEQNTLSDILTTDHTWNQTQDYLSKHIPNYGEVLQWILDDFAKEYLSLVHNQTKQ
jgi:hypothetical protein